MAFSATTWPNWIRPTLTNRSTFKSRNRAIRPWIDYRVAFFLNLISHRPGALRPHRAPHLLSASIIRLYISEELLVFISLFLKSWFLRSLEMHARSFKWAAAEFSGAMMRK